MKQIRPGYPSALLIWLLLLFYQPGPKRRRRVLKFDLGQPQLFGPGGVSLTVELLCNIAVGKAGAVCSFLRCGKHSTGNTSPVNCSEAHGAGLATCVQGSLRHMRVPQHLAGHAYGRYLGVGGGVAILLCPVTGPRNNLAIMNHQSAKRGSAFLDRFHGQLHGLLEKGFVSVVCQGMAHVRPLLIVGSCLWTIITK